jgi:hypothetical protein
VCYASPALGVIACFCRDESELGRWLSRACCPRPWAGTRWGKESAGTLGRCDTVIVGFRCTIAVITASG